MESMVAANNSYTMKKVIITGATGFIGYALAQKISSMNTKIWVVVREGSSRIQQLQKLKNVEIVYCSLDNYCQLDSLIAERDFDVFYHFAWQGVSDQDAHNLDVQMANIQYACDAVNAANALSCRRFVFAASIMEYEVMKLMETEHTADMRNVYRTAKLAAHYMTRTLADNLSIHYNAAVISNVYGAGEISDRFVNATLRKMIRGQRTKFTEAKQLYDFVYIDDAVDMLILIGEQGVKNRNYYIGSMKPRMLKEFIYDMRDCVNKSLELGIGESGGYVGVSLDYDELDIKACQHDFGFVPHYSFSEGINRTAAWLMKVDKDQ